MADRLPMTEGAVTLTEPGNVSTHVFVQDIELVVDVGSYEQFDLQGFLYALVGGGSVTITILTSMIRKDDLAFWKPLGSLSLSLGTGGAPSSDAVTLPLPVLSTTTSADLPTPLLRYVRWKVELTTATSATIEILGLVRRKSL